MALSLRRRHSLLAAIVTVLVGAMLACWQMAAQALSSFETPIPVTGNTTYFDGLGSPYGGCGLPQANLDSQNFVALNVYDTPRDYSFYPRPLTGANLSKRGMWNNGLNCGRWVKVTVGDYCTGVNDGAAGQPFCRNGSWVSDAHNGGTLNMLVADSCGDSNAWCRDDPYHLDLAKNSLNLLSSGMYPDHFNNRHMTWQFIPAPGYSGDISIGMLSGAQVWWPAIAVSHLANGIHGVEYLQNGQWIAAKMNSDMGQSYIIGGTTAGANQFSVRVRDASDQLINGGRVYQFAIPASCGSSCGPAYTAVTYTTSTSSPSPTASPTSSPTPTPSPTSSPTSSGLSCRATYAVTSQWNGAFQAAVTVANTGSAPLAAWRVTWTFANGQTITQIWDGALSASGSGIAVTNLAYNGVVPVNGTKTFGFLGSWNNSVNATPTLTCVAT